jgi:thiamine-monophosphate kinase
VNEIDFIAHYLAPLASPRYAHGLKDDAAHLVDVPQRGLVITADALVCGVHFFADDAPADVAYKALAVNVSDIAAKAAKPLGYTLTLGLSERPTPAFASGLAAGLAEAQAAFGIELLGGDTVAAKGAWWLSVTAFGEAPPCPPLTRLAAKPGDVLYVSGTLGDAALGLRLRRGDAPFASALTAEHRAHVLRRYLRPEPRLGLRDPLGAFASAAMDISDGLSLDLARLCRASACGANVEIDTLPLSDAARQAVASDPAMDAVLSGGDDYEVLAAVPRVHSDTFHAAAARAGVPVTRIGQIVSGNGVTGIFPGGQRKELAAAGYDHFRT